MANFATLKAAINAVIKTNGNKEITGEVLNQVLNAMVTSLGANYQFAGVATPSTNPGTPDQNVFYMAIEAGTYTNFNATVLPAGISILLWNGSWSHQTFFEIDSVPTSGSDNFISSGAVFEKMKLDGGAYDVSAHNEGATFASLSALLSSENLNTLIPVNVRHGGMSVKFVQSSDNKYVQVRCMANSFTTDVTQWQSVDDKPTAGSENLVESGGVEEYINGTIRTTIEQGSFNGREEIQKSNRLRTAGYITEESITISITNGKYLIYALNDNPYIEENSGWRTEGMTYKVAEASKYKIIFGKIDDSDISVSEYASLGVALSCFEKTEVVLKRDIVDNLEDSNSKKPLSAKQGKEIGNRLIVVENKLIKLVGFGTINTGTTGVTNIGDYYFNTSLNVIQKCISLSTPLTLNDFITIPFYDGAIYTYNHSIYVWNGVTFIPYTDYNDILDIYRERLFIKTLVIDDKYISRGIIYDLIGYSYTNPIFVKEGDVITVKTKGSGFSVISKTDEQASSYEELVRADGNNSTLKEYTWVSTEDTYIACSFIKDEHQLFFAFQYKTYLNSNLRENVPSWESNVDYVVGDKINYNGANYICNTNHRSSSVWKHEYWDYYKNSGFNLVSRGNEIQLNTHAYKILKIESFVTTQSALDNGTIYYNYDQKRIRRKIADGQFETIPFFDGAIYTYNDSLYIWDGQDLKPLFNDVYLALRKDRNPINVETHVGFIRPTGEIATNDDRFRYTSPFKVWKGENIVIESNLGGYAVVSATDEQGSFYQCIIQAVSGGENEIYSFTAPEDMFIACSYMENYQNILSLRQKNLLKFIIS